MLAPPPAGALHRNTAAAIRVTQGTSVALSPTRSWGRTLAFTAGDELARRQVFLFGLFDYDCQHGVRGPELRDCSPPTQPFVFPVTMGPGGPDDPNLDGAHILSWSCSTPTAATSGAPGPASVTVRCSS